MGSSWKLIVRLSVVVGIIAGLVGIWQAMAPKTYDLGPPEFRAPPVDAPFVADYSDCETAYPATGICIMRNGGTWIWNEETGMFDPYEN